MTPLSNCIQSWLSYYLHVSNHQYLLSHYCNSLLTRLPCFYPTVLPKLWPGWCLYSAGQLKSLLCSTPPTGPYSLRVPTLTRRPYFFFAPLSMTSLVSCSHSPPAHCSSHTGLPLLPEPPGCSHPWQHLSIAVLAAWTVCPWSCFAHCLTSFRHLLKSPFLVTPSLTSLFKTAVPSSSIPGPSAWPNCCLYRA